MKKLLVKLMRSLTVLGLVAGFILMELAESSEDYIQLIAAGVLCIAVPAGLCALLEIKKPQS